MDPAELFLASLAVIDRVVDRVCRRAGVYGADAEDFASQVRMALIENDYAILRKWEGGSLQTFLAIVAQRLLIDQWRARGRWVPSAEARRRGPVAVTLEALLVRDSRPLSEAIGLARTLHPSVSAAELQRIAAALPHRDPPPRTVAVPEDAEDLLIAQQTAEESASAHEIERVSDRASHVIREALDAMALEDRMLLRFRFATSMTIADIARVLQKPQRPLYRRLEALLADLKRRLAGEGLDAAVLADAIGAPAARIDVGWKNEPSMPSSLQEMAGTAGEQGT